jgi:hypothetical protein
MALSPQDQGLTQLEIGHADRIEKEIDTALARLPAAEKIDLKPQTHFVPELSRKRVEFEVARRYQEAGWQAQWGLFSEGFVLSRKRS